MSDEYSAYTRSAANRPTARLARIVMNPPDQPDRLNVADAAMQADFADIRGDVGADPDKSAAIPCGAGKAFSDSGELEMIE